MRAIWDLFGSSLSLSSIKIEDEDVYISGMNPAIFQPNPLALSTVSEFSINANGPLMQPLLRHLTLPHVQTLDLAGASLNMAYRFISSSMEVRSLSLYGIVETPANRSSTLSLSPIFLSSLETLRVSDFPGLLNYVHAPRLKALTLEDLSRPILYPGGTSLRAFVERSAPALAILHLQGINITDRDIIWCLNQLPDLEDLTVSACLISDAVLSALAAPPSPEHPGWLLPRLAKFEFEGNVGVTSRGAIEFLASRSKDPVPSIAGKFIFPNCNRELSVKDQEAILSYGEFLGPSLAYTWWMAPTI
ncbi:hypothetical protein BOTBODRAFT_373005 [Botryobasidium botryosum FD-172 SS1]|uniref:F-box domain-containing protein n=1 Tax=Botryobasidium botryosum (strain FD-172 SS1) TaxID=930990 RepID=A0A067MNB9_BOTB1|nr:hypothetical protein BOTBODRAFT_373005 [Botryobasidium botryosum FD-172 SS1]